MTGCRLFKSICTKDVIVALGERVEKKGLHSINFGVSGEFHITNKQPNLSNITSDFFTVCRGALFKYYPHLPCSVEEEPFPLLSYHPHPFLSTALTTFPPPTLCFSSSTPFSFPLHSSHRPPPQSSSQHDLFFSSSQRRHLGFGSRATEGMTPLLGGREGNGEREGRRRIE